MILQLLLLPLSVALLQNIDLLAISGVELLLLLLILAIPIAAYQLEFPLFQHRLVLEETTTEHSAGRSLLWMATFKKLFIFCGSLFGAWLILLLSHDLHRYYWYTLYVMSGLVWVIYFSMTRFWLRNEIQAGHRGLIGRKLNQYLIVALLAIMFVYLGYEHVGVPDLRGYRLEDLWAEAFNEKFNAAANHFVGLSLGIIHALSQSAWFFMQVIATTLPDNTYKILVWLVFLLPAAVQAALIIHLQLGLLAIVEWKDKNQIKVLGHSKTARLFFGVFLVVIIGFSWLDFRVGESELRAAAENAGNIITEVDPCRSWGPDDTALGFQELVDIERIGNGVKPFMTELINVKTTFVYKRMDRRIDNYLDWYYSQTTQLKFQILALADLLLGRSGTESALTAELNSKVSLYILAPYTAGMSAANGAFADRANALLEQEFIAYEDQIKHRRRYLSAYQGDLCVIPALVNLEELSNLSGRRGNGPVSSAGSGAAFVVAAVAAKSAGKKLAASVAGKTALKTAAKFGVNLSAKAAAAGSATVAGASFGGMCGPAAPACAVLGGIAAAVIFEIAFNEADEALTRRTAKSELNNLMLNMTIKARNAYLEAYDEIIDDAIKRTFRPEFVPGEQ